jgi:hypothetical protein
MTQEGFSRIEHVRVIRARLDTTHLPVLQLVVQASLRQWGAYRPQHPWSFEAVQHLIGWGTLHKHDEGYLLTDFGADLVSDSV